MAGLPHDDLQAFFRGYIESFDALSASRIAEHYTVPSTVSDSSGAQTLSSAEHVHAKMASYCDNMKALDYEGASFACTACYRLGPDACFVDLEWTIATGAEPLVYKTGYWLHNLDGVWKINSAAVYGF